MSNTNIKLVIIGNSENKRIITEYIAVENNEIKNEIHSIFDILFNKNKAYFNNKNKVKLDHGYAYFIVYPINRIYFIVTEINYPEKIVWDLIDTIDRENIYLLITENGDLDLEGEQALKSIIDSYQDIDKLYKLNKFDKFKDFQYLKNNSNNNRIDKNNIEIKQELDNNAYLKIFENGLKNENKRLLKVNYWKENRWLVIIITLVVILLFIFVIPYFSNIK
jgi:hypothetical protein